jgi:Copper transport outer membrane protein, MctB
VFDFRYHVVSLAAVFLALVLGILVGVAISDPGLADRTDKQNLRDEIARLEGQLEDASVREQSDRAARAFADDAYDVVMEGRLRGIDVGLLVVGEPDDAVVDHVTAAIADAGGDLLRMRALRVPPGDEDMWDELSPAELGRELGEEFVAGEETPMWDEFSSELVLERDGSFDQPADAVVVVRTVPPQSEETARMLRGLYEGIGGSVPAAGAEASTTDPSAAEVWDDAGLSVIDNVDTPVGRVSLTVVLGGASSGHFGVKDGARALVPPIPLLTPPSEDTGG